MATASVLIVDDEPSVLRLVSKAVAGWGYEVYAVSSALQALKLAHDELCFDLVISDVIMPEMCGPEMVRRLSPLPERLGRDDVGSYRSRGASGESRVHQ